ncbi:hypothetical protein KR018_012040, partial [Drosophila ironensis]
MENFSIKLDLSYFFKDYRRQSIILINAAWENIKDVQDHIQNLFSLKDLSLLSNDGCFLPPRESVQVLKGIDGLKAFRLEDADADSFVVPEAPVTSKKRKNRSLEATELTSPIATRPPKRSKSKNSTILSGNLKETELKSNSSGFPKTRDKSLSPKGRAKADDTQAKEVVVEDSPEPTKKGSSHNYTPNDNSEEEPSQSSGKESNSFDKRTRGTDLLTVAMDLDENVPKKKPKPEPEALFRCPLMEMDSNMPRIFQLPRKSNKIEILEDITIKPPNNIVTPTILQASNRENIDVPACSESVTSTEKTEEDTSLVLSNPEEPRNRSYSPEDMRQSMGLSHISEENTFDLSKRESLLPDETVDVENIGDESYLSKSEATTDTSAQKENKLSEASVIRDSKMKTPGKNKISPVAAQNLDSGSDDDVMLVDDTIYDSDSDVEAVPLTDVVKKPESLISELLAQSKELQFPPNRGDTIIFQLRTNKGSSHSDYTPHLAVECVYVNRRTKCMTANII